MEVKRKINEVAKMFNVSVPTLHYWEQEGLFTINRNEDNQYRQYEMADLFNIWEIRLYRDLDISIKEIKQILNSDLDVQMETYHRQEKLIAEKIKQLKFVQQEVRKQVRCGDEAIALDKAGIAPGKPDMNYFVGTPSTMEYGLTYPNDGGMMITADATTQSNSTNGADHVNMVNRIAGTAGRDEYTRGICLDTLEQMDKVDFVPPEARDYKDIAQPLPIDTNKDYMEFLLKININNYQDNNLTDIRSQLSKQGYQTGTVYARYLLMGGSLPDRYEYYHAWIEISS